MRDEKCVVVYKKVHGEKVVAIAVSQDRGGQSRVHTLVCRIRYDYDFIQMELNKHKPGNQIIGSLVPESYSSSSVCILPPLPVSDGPKQDKNVYQLHVESWVLQVGLKVDDIATSTLTQSCAFPELSEQPLLPLAETLIAETLVAGVFGAWGFQLIARGNKLTRSLEERRPLVRALERTIPLFGLQSNIKIYADAFGFGIEKAHKDVRTYRETVRRMEQQSFG